MFRNRGEVPNINVGKGIDLGENEGYSAPNYSHYWNGRFIIIKYDKTFVAIELIAVLLMLIIASATYLFTYKVRFEDPIATVKSNFLTAQLISIITSMGLIAVVTFFTKSSKEKLIRNLKIISIICSVAIIVFLGIKISMDKKYNKNVFAEFYEKYEKVNNTKNASKIKVGITGVEILNSKESYIEDSTKAYNVFTVKTVLYMVLQVLIVILTIYLSYRLTNIEIKKERLAKDDEVLYDEEQNVKY